MSTDANRGKRTQTNSRTNKKKKSKKGRIILFAVELLIIVGMLIVLWKLRDFGNQSISRVEFKPGEIVVNQQVQENVQLKGYRNIALFGVDSRNGSLGRRDENGKKTEAATLSDSIIIASINMDTGDVKLVSIYRDTYLNLMSYKNDESYKNLTDGKYSKCNSAYSAGGPAQAINMLNTNLDLNIEDFVTVGFEGLKNAIDELGGVWIEVDSAEIKHINNYQMTMAKDLDCDYKSVTKTGYQKLDGLQAVAYCRIRYTGGSDYKRAERQREVIQAIVEEARQANVETLVKIANKITESDVVYTSLDLEDITSLIKDIAKYKIVEEGGFPLETYRGTADMGDSGNCVLALDLEKNVQWLHGFLFEDEDYKVSENVSDISKQIRQKISKYEPNMKYPE